MVYFQAGSSSSSSISTSTSTSQSKVQQQPMPYIPALQFQSISTSTLSPSVNIKNVQAKASSIEARLSKLYQLIKNQQSDTFIPKDAEQIELLSWLERASDSGSDTDRSSMSTGRTSLESVSLVQSNGIKLDAAIKEADLKNFSLPFQVSTNGQVSEQDLLLKDELEKRINLRVKNTPTLFEKAKNNQLKNEDLILLLHLECCELLMEKQNTWYDSQLDYFKQNYSWQRMMPPYYPDSRGTYQTLINQFENLNDVDKVKKEFIRLNYWSKFCQNKDKYEVLFGPDYTVFNETILERASAVYQKIKKLCDLSGYTMQKLKESSKTFFGLEVTK